MGSYDALKSLNQEKMMYQLEDRILFDAAAAVDVAEANEHTDVDLADEVPNVDDHAEFNSNTDNHNDATDHDNVPVDHEAERNKEDLLIELASQMESQSAKDVHVLLISDEVKNADQIASLVKDGTIVIKYDASDITASDLIDLIKENTGTNEIGSIGFITETSKNGTVQVFSETTTLTNLTNDTQSSFWDAIDNLVADGGDVNFFTSNLAKTNEGTQLLDNLAADLDADVNASSDYTGGEKRNADWTLEYAENGENVDLKDVYFADDLAVDDLKIETNEKRELYVINGIIPDRDKIISNLGEDAEYIVLDNQDALDQLLESLDGQGEYDAIHLVTNGGKGYFRMGYDVVDGDYMTDNKASFSRLGDSLTDDGDILIYGCELTANNDGVSLVNFMADITDADIAASDDITGHGGDWDLEYTVGDIDTKTYSFNDYEYHLAGITVNCIEDYKVDPNDQRISVREAIKYAADGETVSFIKWDKMLDYKQFGSINDLAEFKLTKGQLNIERNVTINGSVHIDGGLYLAATIDAQGFSRAFFVHGKDNAPITVNFIDMIIENGHAKGTTDADGSGAGVYIGSNVTMLMKGVDIQDGIADVNGGGIFNNGKLTFEEKILSGSLGGKILNNQAQNGGGIYSLGELTIVGKSSSGGNVYIEKNDADVNGGGIYSSGLLVMRDVIMSHNYAGVGIDVDDPTQHISGNGGAIYSIGEIDRLEAITFKNNRASDSGGALFVSGAKNDAHFYGMGLVENVATFGGAIAYVNSKGLDISSILAFDNHANLDGGTIYFKNNKGNLKIHSDNFYAAKYKYEDGKDHHRITDWTTAINDSTAGRNGSIIYMVENDANVELILDRVAMSTNSDVRVEVDDKGNEIPIDALYIRDVAGVSFNKVNLIARSTEFVRDSDGFITYYTNSENGSDDIVGQRVLFPDKINWLGKDVLESLNLRVGDILYNYGNGTFGISRRGFTGSSINLFYIENNTQLYNVLYEGKFYNGHLATEESAADALVKYKKGDVIFDMAEGLIGIQKMGESSGTLYEIVTGDNKGGALLIAELRIVNRDTSLVKDVTTNGLNVSLVKGDKETISITNSTFANFNKAIIIVDPTVPTSDNFNGAKLIIQSSTFSSSFSNKIGSNIEFSKGTLSIKDSTFYNAGIELKDTGEETVTVTISNSAFVGDHDIDLKQIYVKNLDSIKSFNIDHTMISHYYQCADSLKGVLNTGNLAEITVGTQAGKSLLNSKDEFSTMTSTKGVLDSRGNMLGMSAETSNFLSTFSFIDSTLRTQGDKITQTHAVMYEQSLLYGYYVAETYTRAGQSSAATDQRGANRNGYYLKDGKLINWRNSSIGSFESIFYTIVDSKGDDMFIRSDYSYDVHSYNLHDFDKAKSTYKDWDEYTSDEQEAMLAADPDIKAKIAKGSTGMTLREGEYWIDTFDRDLSQSVSLNGVVFKNGSKQHQIQIANNINLYDYRRYVHFDKEVFNEDAENNTINLATTIFTGRVNTAIRDIRKDVMIGTAFSSAIAFDSGASFIDAGGTVLTYDDGKAQDNSFMAQDNEKRIDVVNAGGRVFLNGYEETLIINNLSISGHITVTGQIGSVAASGGAIRNQGELILNNVLIHDSFIKFAITQTGSYVDYAHGGGLYNAGDAVAAIYNSTFENNELYITGVTNHHSSKNSGFGGAIYNAGDMTIENSLIVGNELSSNTKDPGLLIDANLNGGGIYHDAMGDYLAIVNTTIANNIIHLTNGSQVTENSGFGSAIYLENADEVLLVNNTIVNNQVRTKVSTAEHAKAEQAAVYIKSDNRMNLRMVNNIIANNLIFVDAHIDVNIANDFYIAKTSNIDFSESNNLVGAYYYDGKNSNAVAGYNFDTANKSIAMKFTNQISQYQESAGKFYLIEDVDGGFIDNLNLAENLEYNGGKTKSYRVLDGSIAFGFGSGIDAKNAVRSFNLNNNDPLSRINLNVRSISGSNVETGQSVDQRGLFRDYDKSNWNVGSYESLMKVTVTSNSSGVISTGKGYVYNANSYLNVGTALGYFDSTTGEWVQQHMTIEEALSWVDGAGAAKIVIDLGAHQAELQFKEGTGEIYYEHNGNEYFLCGQYKKSLNGTISIDVDGFEINPDKSKHLMAHNGKIVAYSDEGNTNTSEVIDNFYKLLEQAGMNFDINGNNIKIDEQGRFYYEDNSASETVLYYLYADIAKNGTIGTSYFKGVKEGDDVASTIKVDDHDYKILTLNKIDGDKGFGNVSAGGSISLYTFYNHAKDASIISINENDGIGSGYHLDIEYQDNVVTFNDDDDNTNSTPDIFFTTSNGERFLLYGVYSDIEKRETGYAFYRNDGSGDLKKPLYQYNLVEFNYESDSASEDFGKLSASYRYANSVSGDFANHIFNVKGVKSIQPEDISVVDFDASHTITINGSQQSLWVTGRGSLDDLGIYFNNRVNTIPGTDSAITFNKEGALIINKNITIDGKIKCDEDSSVNSQLAGKNVLLDAENKSRIFIIDNLKNDNLSTAILKNLTLVNGNSKIVAPVGEVPPEEVIVPVENGGAIYSSENLTLRDVVITDSSTAGKGGAVYNQAGNLTLISTKIENVSAEGRGGAIFAVNGNFSMSDSNISLATSGAEGGAISLDSVKNVYIENSGLAYNEAETVGGALSIVSSHEIILNSVTIANNIAGEEGGGVFISGGIEQHFNYVTIANNKAGKNAFTDEYDYYGGGLYVESGAVYVENSIISQNSYYSRTVENKLIDNESNSNIATDSLTTVTKDKFSIVQTDAGISRFAESNNGSFKVYVLSGSIAENHTDKHIPVDQFGNEVTFRPSWTTAGAYEKVRKVYVYQGKDNIGDTATYTSKNEMFKGGIWLDKDTGMRIDISLLTSSWDTTYIIDGGATVILDNGAVLDTGAKNSLLIDDVDTTKTGRLIINDATVSAVLTVAAKGTLVFGAGSVYNLPVVSNKYAPGGEYSITDRINNGGTITFKDDRSKNDYSKRFATVNSMIALNENGTINFETDTIKGDFSLTVNEFNGTTINYNYDSTITGQSINRYGLKSYYNLGIKGVGHKFVSGDVIVHNVLSIGSSTEQSEVTFNNSVISDTVVIDNTKITARDNFTSLDGFKITSSELQGSKDITLKTKHNIGNISGSSVNAQNIGITNDREVNITNSNFTANNLINVSGRGRMNFSGGEGILKAKTINFDNTLNVFGENTALTFKSDNINYGANPTSITRGGKLTFDIKSDITLIEKTGHENPGMNIFNLGLFTVAQNDGISGENELHFNSGGNLDFGIAGDSTSNVKGAAGIEGIIGFGAKNISFEKEFKIDNATVAFNSAVSILDDSKEYVFGKGVIFNDKVTLGAGGNYTIKATERMVEFNGEVIGNNSALTIIADAAVSMTNAAGLASLTLTSKTSNVTLSGNITASGNIKVTANNNVVVNNAKVKSVNGEIDIDADDLNGNSAEFIVDNANVAGSELNFNSVLLTGSLRNTATMKVADYAGIVGDLINSGSFSTDALELASSLHNSGTLTVDELAIGDNDVSNRRVHNIYQTGTANVNLLRLVNSDVTLMAGDLEVNNFDFNNLRVNKTFNINKNSSLYVKDKISNADVNNYFNLQAGGTLYQNAIAKGQTDFYVGTDDHSILIEVNDENATVDEKLGVKLTDVKNGNVNIKGMDTTLGFQLSFDGIKNSQLAGDVDIYYHSDNVGDEFAGSDGVYTAYNTDGSSWTMPEFDAEGNFVPGSSVFKDKLDNLDVNHHGYNKNISMVASMNETSGMTFTFALLGTDFSQVDGDMVFLNANQQFWVNQELVNSATYRVRYNDMAYKANTKAFLKRLRMDGLTDTLGGEPESGIAQASLLANDNGIIFENNSQEFYGAMDGTYAVGIDAYQGTTDLIGDFAAGSFENYGEAEVQGALESIMIEMAEEKDLFDTHPAVTTGPDSVISWFQRQVRSNL